MSNNALVPVKQTSEKDYSTKETLTFSLLSFVLGCLLTGLVSVSIFAYLYIKLVRPVAVPVVSQAPVVQQAPQPAYYPPQVQSVPQQYVQHAEVPSHTDIEVHNTDTAPAIDNPIFPPIPEAPKKAPVRPVEKPSPPPSIQYVAPNYNTPSDVHLGVQ